MSDDALEPKLTAFDLRVLRALPAMQDGEFTPQMADEERAAALTPWQMGEALADLDVAHLRAVLRGLNHLGYANAVTRGKVEAFWRSRRGDEAIA